LKDKDSNFQLQTNIAHFKIQIPYSGKALVKDTANFEINDLKVNFLGSDSNGSNTIWFDIKDIVVRSEKQTNINTKHKQT